MSNVSLNVILRTHTGRNVHAIQRVAPFSKAELVVGCARSLSRSITAARDIADIRFTTIDDHSTEEATARMKELGNGCGVPFEFIHLDDTGNNASLRAVYKYAREHGRELIYFVEDDYLHSTAAIREMVEEYLAFKKNLGKVEVGIYPVDYLDRYKPEFLREARIVLGKNRHWRTVYSTTGTLMVTRDLFLSQYDKFWGFSFYGLTPDSQEAGTLNKIWDNGAGICFSPIPTLAIHMSEEEVLPPFINWRDWWKRYAI